MILTSTYLFPDRFLTSTITALDVQGKSPHEEMTSVVLGSHMTPKLRVFECSVVQYPPLTRLLLLTMDLNKFHYTAVAGAHEMTESAWRVLAIL